MGATLTTTLEPCDVQGLTGPCTEAIIAAGVTRVVVGVVDPDPRVAGGGVDRLRRAGLVVDVLDDPAVASQLEPYLHHRRTGRPFVVAKVAASLDGGIAAPDGSSQWITGGAARADVHRLRAESGAILVGAGTIRADDPALTVRHADGPDPLRVVLGSVPEDARVRPCLEWRGDIRELLDELGRRGVLQLLVEGGSTVLRTFHDLDLIDRWVVYVAPAMFGGSEMRPLLAPPTTPTIDEVWRGRFDDVTRLGDDLRIGLRPARAVGSALVREED